MPTVYEPRPRPQTWKENSRSVIHRWSIPFHWIEWLTQWTAYYLSHWSFLEVLEYVGRFTVLIAVVLYFVEAPDRRKQKHYKAWQVINSAQGQTGGGGRVEALQELHDDGVALIALDVRGAYLQGLKLPETDLHRSRMTDADLRNADFRGADLQAADLGANLQMADLRAANLQGADLRNADLRSARLDRVDLTGARLDGSELDGASLRDAKWKQIRSIQGANVANVMAAPPGFVDWAVAHGAIGRTPPTTATAPAGSQ